jgi:hypothetical protein
MEAAGFNESSGSGSTFHQQRGESLSEFLRSVGTSGTGRID